MQTIPFTYTFTLQADKKKVYLLMQRLLLLINLALILFSFISSWLDIKRSTFLSVFFVAAASLLIFNKRNRAFFTNDYSIEKIMGLSFGISWIGAGVYSIGIIALFLTFLFSIATADTIIQIGEKIIIKTGLFKKTYSWNLIEQVILKDGLLTIDFKTNRLLQQHVGKNGVDNEIEFNTYCQRQL
ncbi:MAG: hypothetical protein ACO3Z2_01185 [Chitinophagaceae bacterium]